MTSNRQGYRAWVFPLLIALAATTTRIAFLVGSPDRDWPHAALYEGDAPLWAKWANAINEGRPFELNLPVHPPGMAYCLSALLQLNLHRPFLVGKVVMCIFGAATCVLVFFAGRRRFGDSAASIAALLGAGSFGLLAQCGTLNSEVIYTFLLVACLWLTDRAVWRNSILAAIALGLAHGAAVLFRPEHLLLCVLMWIYTWKVRSETSPGSVNRPNRRARIQVIVLILFFLVPLPWNIRSYFAIQRFNKSEANPIAYDHLRPPWTPDAIERIRSLPAFAREGNVRYVTFLASEANLIAVDREFVDRFFDERMEYLPQAMSPLVFVSNQGALSFALANHSLADGGFSTSLLDSTGPSDFAFGNPRHLRLYQQGYSIGFNYLMHHPREAGELLIKKLAIFASGFSQGLTVFNWPLSGELTRRPVDQAAAPIAQCPVWLWSLFGLAVVGIAVSLYQRRGFHFLLVLIYKLLVTLAFYGYARQAVSILPVFYLFAALGLDFLLIRPTLRFVPAVRRMATWVLATAAFFIAAIGFWTGHRGWEYQIDGPAEAAPRWGPGAFESTQQLRIKQSFSPSAFPS